MIDDATLLEVFLRPVRKCAEYRPAFGLGRQRGVKVAEFRRIYGQDAFYSWLGLDNPAVYAAHKAAGGLTSVYRQIGVGSERLFREVVAHQYSLDEDQMRWSYAYDKGRGKTAVHTLDARISLRSLKGRNRTAFEAWLDSAKATVAPADGSQDSLSGAAFEIRQGYKSADAYSGPIRPRIPEQSVQAFRSKASTDSGDAVLPFRHIPSTPELSGAG